MKKDKQDKLKGVFSQIKSESPSMGFESNLMQQIRIAHQLAERKKKRLALLSMVVAVLSMILLPTIVLRFLGWSLLDVLTNSDVTLLSAFSSIKIDPMILSVSVVCLVLLIVDLLVRRYINQKEEENSK